MPEVAIGRIRPEHGLFLASGAGSLMFQVVWLRDMGLVLGNDAQAAALVLSVFFLGLAIGGEVWGRRAASFAHPLRAYAGLELGVSVLALLLLLSRDWLIGWYPELAGRIADPRIATIATGGVAAVFLLPPTILMGGTLPAMAQHLVSTRAMGRDGALLYAANTVGAVCGVLLAGFVLPRVFGYRGTYLWAIGLTLSVATTAWLLSRGRSRVARGQVAEGRTDNAESGPTDGVLPAPAIVIAVLSGALTLGIEFLWIRMFSLVLQNSVYSFAAILAAFLAALSVGALVASRLARTSRNPQAVLAGLLTLAGLATAATGPLFFWATDGLSYATVQGGWWTYLVAVFALGGAIIFVPGACLGAVFPYLFKTVEPLVSATGPALGRLVMANSIGAAAGPLIAGFVLLPGIGLWAALSVAALVYMAVALWQHGRAGSAVGARLAALVAIGLVVATLPWANRPKLDLPAGSRIGGIWHGSLGTVAVVESDGNLMMTLDNHYTLGDTRSLGTERLQTHVPLVLHPDARSVFYLGLGTGITAGAALDHPVERVVAAELVPEVIPAARSFFQPFVNGLFDDPRVSVATADGRGLLNRSTERYDVIIADLFTPWHAGTGALYSVEHFSKVRSRLTEGGLFAQWVAGYQLSRAEFNIIARTMLQVFPNVTLWRANFSPDRPVLALVGVESPVEFERFRRGAARTFGLDVPAAPWESVAGLFYVGDLSDRLRTRSETPVNTDDRPIIEFIAPIRQRSHLAGTSNRLVGESLAGLMRELQDESASGGPFVAGATSTFWDGVRAGQALVEANVLAAAGDAEAAATRRRAFNEFMPPGVLERLEGFDTSPSNP